MAMKAIHLELVSNLISEAFIAALQHFINRRGLTDHLYSDNGSNFVGANRKLKACAFSMQQRHNFSGILFLPIHPI